MLMLRTLLEWNLDENLIFILERLEQIPWKERERNGQHLSVSRQRARMFVLQCILSRSASESKEEER